MKVKITVAKLISTRNLLLEVYQEHKDNISDRYARAVLDVRNLLADIIDDIEEE